MNLFRQASILVVIFREVSELWGSPCHSAFPSPDHIHLSSSASLSLACKYIPAEGTFSASEAVEVDESLGMLSLMINILQAALAERTNEEPARTSFDGLEKSFYCPTE